MYVSSPQFCVYMMHYVIPIHTNYYCFLRSREINVFYLFIIYYLATPHAIQLRLTPFSYASRHSATPHAIQLLLTPFSYTP
jgi:hypothetical protein